MDGFSFMGRALSLNSVMESVKSRRVLICRDIMGVIPCPYDLIYSSLLSHFDQAPVSIGRLQAMTRWFTHSSHVVSDAAQARVAMNLLRMQERDNRWIALACDVYGLAARDIEDNVALGGDNVLLAILIHVSRQAIHSYKQGMFELLEALTQIDIRHTIPGLQHDFCTLWNELVQEAKKQGSSSTPVDILQSIRHLFIALHQSTDAAPTAFSRAASTDSFPILDGSSSYPLYDIAKTRRARPLMFLFSPNLLILLMPCLTGLLLTVTLFYNKPRKQATSQHFRYLIRRHLEKSEAVLRPPQPLHPPSQLLLAHIPQMHYHQALWPLRCKILPRPPRFLAPWKVMRSRIYSRHTSNPISVKLCPPCPRPHLQSQHPHNMF